MIWWIKSPGQACAPACPGRMIQSGSRGPAVTVMQLTFVMGTSETLFPDDYIGSPVNWPKQRYLLTFEMSQEPSAGHCASSFRRAESSSDSCIFQRHWTISDTLGHRKKQFCRQLDISHCSLWDLHIPLGIYSLGFLFSPCSLPFFNVSLPNETECYKSNNMSHRLHLL